MESERKLNVAVIGCGCVAGYGHMPAITRVTGLNCVAFIDKDISKAKNFVKRFGPADVYDDYHEVLRREDIDIIAILTLPSAHCEIAVAALKAGKHVFTEKPISSNVNDGRKMVQTARESGRKLFVGFLLRFTGIYQEMARLIHDGIIGGPILYILGGYERYQPDDEFSWNRALDFIGDTSCGFDCGSHYVDLMRWYSGAEAVSVQGMGVRINADVPEGMFDYENYQIQFNDGSRGIYSTGWGFSFPERPGFKGAIGPKGHIAIRFDEIIEGKESGAKLVFRPNGGDEEIVTRSSWKGFEAEWSYFYKMINEGLDPFPSLDDAIKSLEIVEAAHESALRNGTSIKLKY